MIAAVRTVAKVGVETPGVFYRSFGVLSLGFLLFRLLRCRGRFSFQLQCPDTFK